MFLHSQGKSLTLINAHSFLGYFPVYLINNAWYCPTELAIDCRRHAVSLFFGQWCLNLNNESNRHCQGQEVFNLVSSHKYCSISSTGRCAIKGFRLITFIQRHQILVIFALVFCSKSLDQTHCLFYSSQPIQALVTDSE